MTIGHNVSQNSKRLVAAIHQGSIRSAVMKAADVHMLAATAMVKFAATPWYNPPGKP